MYALDTVIAPVEYYVLSAIQQKGKQYIYIYVYKSTTSRKIIIHKS